MQQKPIDVWDRRSFDNALIDFLQSEAALIHDYLVTERQIVLQYDRARGPNRNIFRPDNPHTHQFHCLLEAMDEEMKNRTIRAFHYTRLTDAEVAILWDDGIHLSTPATLRRRLDVLMSDSLLAPEIADGLYAASPFHSQQREARSNKFWMTSYPVSVDDSGVEPLMARWGGEVGSSWMEDPTFLALLTRIGKRRIIELAVPLALTDYCSYLAGEAVIATFGRSLGCIPDKDGFFDFYVTAPLLPEAILAVHSEGDSTFAAMGRTYPKSDIMSERYK